MKVLGRYVDSECVRGTPLIALLPSQTTQTAPQDAQQFWKYLPFLEPHEAAHVKSVNNYGQRHPPNPVRNP